MANANNKYTIEIDAEFKQLKKKLADLQIYEKRIRVLNNKDISKDQKDVIKRQMQKDRFDKIKRKEEESHQKKLDTIYKKRYQEETKQFKKQQNEYKRFLSNANNFRLMSNYPGGKPGILSRADQWLVKNKSPVTLSGMKGAAGFLGRVGGGILGGLAGFLMGGATAGYGKYMEYGSALGNAIGYGRNSGMSTRGGIRGAHGGRLGYSLIDTANQVGSMARNTGVTGPRELQEGMRATGLDQGELGSIYGTIRQAGTTFDNPQGNGQGVTRANSPGGKEFQKMISLGMASGLERGRLPEFFQGVTQLVQEQGSRSAGDINVTEFSKQLAMLGRSGNSGFQGARGASILSKLSQGIVNPGGGEYGQVFMRQAMGFGKPGGNTTYYQAEKMREQGIKDPKNIQRMISETVSQHGSGQEGALHLRELTGVSLEQAEELFKIYDSSKSSEEKLKDMQKVANESKSLEEQSLDQMKGIGGQVRRIAGRTDVMISVGSKVASTVEKIEDWQTQLLFWLIKMAKDIADIVQMFKSWLEDFAQKGQKSMAAVQAVNTRYGSARFTTDPAQQDKALSAYIAEMRAQKEAAMSGGSSIKNQIMGQGGDFAEAARTSTLGEAQARAIQGLSAKYANAYGTAPGPDEMAKIRRIVNTDPGLQEAANMASRTTGAGIPAAVSKAATEAKLVEALNNLQRSIDASDLKGSSNTYFQLNLPNQNPGGRPNVRMTSKSPAQRPKGP